MPAPIHATRPAPGEDALRAVPKAELHLHLDGSVRPSTVEDLARARGVLAADAPPGAAMERVAVSRRAGLMEALAGFDLLLPIMQTPADLARITRELVADLAAEGVVYAELRFCPRLVTEQGMTCEQALAVAAEAAADAGGTRTRLIACLMGGVDPAWNDPVVDAAIARRGDGVVAVDLAGAVTGRDAAWVEATARQFARARDAGLEVTVHAGEAEPPAAIRTALDRYGATRIGHATSLVDDPDLLAEVVDRRVVLESCPGSNYWTRTPAEMPSLAEHPLGRLLAAGARACCNTDDRSLFANTLSGELATIAAVQGLDATQVDTLIDNGFAGAFDQALATAARERGTTPA